jgi:hypothetical protein
LFLSGVGCSVEHMFDTRDASVELLAGEADTTSVWCDEGFDDLVYAITVEELNTGWVEEDRDVLPDLDSIPPGPFLFLLLEGVDRARLNGFDLVEVLKARERLVSHCQAGAVADVYELAYAAPGDSGSDPERLAEAFEFAADELRPALRITRQAAKNRLGVAFDLKERLPGIWEMLDRGLIDLARARVVCNGTAHLDTDEARRVAETVAERAPRLTTGQLGAWIRRLCVESDPEKAQKRYDRAKSERRLWIEQTESGTGNVYLLDIDIADARAIGRRVNAHMISLRRDGDDRSHDNLRADIAVDLLLGSDPTNGGRGMMDMRVSMTTLAGLDDQAAEIPGLGPVIADVARKFADLVPRAEWRATITDDFGNVAAVVTTSRRPTRQISRLVDATQPTCAFPGCRVPARDCDYDHLLPRSQGGQTSTTNGGPKCRHDHILKDHGWTHQRVDGNDIWTSPHGHTYTTEKPP